MTFKKRIIALPVLALALAGAGCGGGADDDFIASYNEATTPLAQLTTDLATAPAAGGRGAERKLVKMADGLDAVHDRLSGLDAPGDVAEEYDRMLEALDANAAQVRTMAKAVRKGDLERLAAEAQEFSVQGTELVQAEQSLRTALER